MPRPARRDLIRASIERTRLEAARLWTEPTLRRLAVGWALVVLGIVAFLGVLDAVREMDDLASLDTPVLNWLVAARSPVVTAVLTAVTTVAGPVVLPIAVAVGAFGWGLWRREWRPVVLLVGALVVSTLVASAVKLVVARPRPPVDSQLIPGLESTYSFPSGHTAGAATLFLVLGYLVWVRHPTPSALVGWSGLAVVGIGAVALSRLYLGYHFVTDVAASVALGIAVLGVVVLVDRPSGAAPGGVQT